MDKALELADILENRCEEHQLNASYMLRQQKVEIDRLTMLCDCMTTESNRKGNEIEALKKQIPDWENINKPNPFIGWEKSLVAVDSNPNSGLGGIALKKESEK